MVIENETNKGSHSLKWWGAFVVVSTGVGALGLASIVFSRVAPNHAWLIKHKGWFNPAAYTFTALGATGLSLVGIRLFFKIVCCSKKSVHPPYMRREKIQTTQEGEHDIGTREIKCFQEEEEVDLEATKVQHRADWQDYLNGLKDQFGEKNVAYLTNDLVDGFDETPCNGDSEAYQRLNAVKQHWEECHQILGIEKQTFIGVLDGFKNLNPFSQRLRAIIIEETVAVILGHSPEEDPKLIRSVCQRMLELQERSENISEESWNRIEASLQARLSGYFPKAEEITLVEQWKQATRVDFHEERTRSQFYNFCCLRRRLGERFSPDDQQVVSRLSLNVLLLSRKEAFFGQQRLNEEALQDTLQKIISSSRGFIKEREYQNLPVPVVQAVIAQVRIGNDADKLATIIHALNDLKSIYALCRLLNLQDSVISCQAVEGELQRVQDEDGITPIENVSALKETLEEFSRLREGLQQVYVTKHHFDERTSLKGVHDKLRRYLNQQDWAPYLEGLKDEFGDDNIDNLLRALPKKFRKKTFCQDNEHKVRLEATTSYWRQQKQKLNVDDRRFNEYLRTFHDPRDNPLWCHLKESTIRPIARRVLQLAEDWGENGSGFSQKHPQLFDNKELSGWVIKAGQPRANKQPSWFSSIQKDPKIIDTICLSLLHGENIESSPLVNLIDYWLQEALDSYAVRLEGESVHNQFQRIVKVDFLTESTRNAWNNYWQVYRSFFEIVPESKLGLSRFLALQAMLGDRQLRDYFFGRKAIENPSRFLEAVCEQIIARNQTWQSITHFARLPQKLIENTVRYVSSREGKERASSKMLEILHRLDHIATFYHFMVAQKADEEKLNIFIGSTGIFFSGLPSDSHKTIQTVFAFWSQGITATQKSMSAGELKRYPYYSHRLSLQAVMRLCSQQGDLHVEVVEHDLSILSENISKQVSYRNYYRCLLREHALDYAKALLNTQTVQPQVDKLIWSLVKSFGATFFSKTLTKAQLQLFSSLLCSVLKWQRDHELDVEAICQALKKTQVLRTVEEGKTEKFTKSTCKEIENLEKALLQQQALKGKGSVSGADLAVSMLRSPAYMLDLVLPLMGALKLDDADKNVMQNAVQKLKEGLEKSDLLAWGWHYVRVTVAPFLPLMHLFNFNLDKSHHLIDFKRLFAFSTASIQSIVHYLDYYQDHTDFDALISAIEKDSKFPMGRQIILWMAHLLKVVHRSARSERIEIEKKKKPEDQKQEAPKPSLPIIELRALPWIEGSGSIELTAANGTMVLYQQGQKGEVAYFRGDNGKILCGDDYNQIVTEASSPNSLSIIHVYHDGQEQPLIIRPSGYDEQGNCILIKKPQEKASANPIVSSFVDAKIDGLQESIQLTSGYLALLDFLRGKKKAKDEWNEKKAEGGWMPALASYLGALTGQALPWMVDNGMKLAGGSASLLGFAVKYTLKPMIWASLKAMNSESIKTEIVGLQAYGERYIQEHLAEWLVMHQFLASGECSGMPYKMMIALTKNVTAKNQHLLKRCIVLVHREMNYLVEQGVINTKHRQHIQEAVAALIHLEKQRLGSLRKSHGTVFSDTENHEEKALIDQNGIDERMAHDAVLSEIEQLHKQSDEALLKAITPRAFEIFLIDASDLKNADLSKLDKQARRRARINAIVKGYGLDTKKLNAFLDEIKKDCFQRHQDKARQYVEEHFAPSFRAEMDNLKVGTKAQAAPILPADEERILRVRFQMEQERRVQTTLGELYADITGSLWENFHTLEAKASHGLFARHKKKQDILQGYGIGNWKLSQQAKTRDAIKQREFEICMGLASDDSKFVKQIEQIQRKMATLEQSVLELAKKNKNGVKNKKIQKLQQQQQQLQSQLEEAQQEHEQFLSTTPKGIAKTLGEWQKELSSLQKQLDANAKALSEARLHQSSKKEIGQLEKEKRQLNSKITEISQRIDSKQEELEQGKSKTSAYEDIYLNWQRQEQLLLLAQDLLDPIIDLFVTLVWGVVQTHEDLGEYQRHFAEFADGALDAQAHPAQAMQGALRLLGRLLKDTEPYMDAIYDSINAMPETLKVVN